MKITLVQPPILVDSTYALNPPLGLLMLGAALREESVDVEIVDLNLKGMQTPSLLHDESFYTIALNWILETSPDVVGFTSMALESHVCLELAKLIKQQDDSIITIFGGPHFSSIAPQMLELYTWVDYVFTGEAEKPIAEFANFLRGNKSFSELNNVARNTSSGVELNRQFRANTPISELPFPAHDLVNLNEYFAINKYKILCMEHARGCQLRCSFCYSEAHWGHGENVKSIERIITELTDMSKLGAGMIYLVADNFLTNTKAAEELCAEIENANLPLQWMCYGTLAQVRETPIKAMARAGCNSIFIGVDAVSPTNKKEFRKHYFKNWEKLEGSLRLCLDHGITPTCSFMFSSADTAEGIEETLNTAIFAKNVGAKVWLNALNVYNKTHCHKTRREQKLEYCELKPRLTYDTAATNHVNPFAMEHPELFPMHQAVIQTTEMDHLYEFCFVAFLLVIKYPITLLRLIIDTELKVSETVLDIVDRTSEVITNTKSKSISRSHEIIDKEFSNAMKCTTGLYKFYEYEKMEEETDNVDKLQTINFIVGGDIRSCVMNPYKIFDFPTLPEYLNSMTKFSTSEVARRFAVTIQNGFPYCIEIKNEYERIFLQSKRCTPECSLKEIPISQKTFHDIRYRRFVRSISRLH